MNLNILIINQDDDVSRIISRFLESEGHRTTCIPCEINAVESALQLCPELIIIEIAMVELPAIEIISRLRQQRISVRKFIPIIVVSDFPSLEFELLHISDFICKPVDLERLRESIDILAGGRDKKKIREKNASLSPEEHKIFHDYLIVQTGLYFDRHNIKILERGLEKRMATLRIKSYNDYYDYLTESIDRRHELQKLLQLLTVGESFFFRQQSHFAAMINKVLPDIIKTGGAKIRLWSAGCSTGEEPYSIAMAVMEAVPDWKKRDIRILATDINNHSLMRAVEGGYNSWKIRVTEKKYLDKYFNRIGENYVVKDEVKTLVDFTHQDLLAVHSSSDQLMTACFDAIFCRNVMIYFTRETTRKVVDSFASVLKPGGNLFLGHSETLLQLSTKFERQLHNGGYFYQKRVEQQPASDRVCSIASLAANTENLPMPARTGSEQQPASFSVCAEKCFNLEATYKEAIARKHEKNYVLAKNLFRQILDRIPDHKDAILGEAMILVYSGHFDEALERCNRALQIDDLLPGAYFLRGFVYDQTDRKTEAIDEYRKAILLEMDFVMPQYQLGKLYSRCGQYNFSKRALKNSLKLLEKGGAEMIIPYSGGLSREVFLEQLHDELTRIDAALAI